MENILLSDFINLFPGITDIINREAFLNRITIKNLPTKLNKGEKRYIKFKKDDISVIESELYQAFLGNNFSNNLISTFNNDFESLRNNNSNIPNFRKFIKSIRKNINGTNCNNSNNFWEKFYELNIIACLSRIYQLNELDISIEGQDKDFDLKISILENDVNIDIVTLSIPGYKHVRKSGERNLDEYFKNKIDRQISYDLISRQDFSYSKNQIDLIINDFEKNINDFIEHGQLKQIIYDERGIMIASIKIQFDEYHQGARISNHDNNPYLYSTIDKYIKTIKNKSLTKLQAFPIDGYNFLLVNIASQHPIWLIYFDLEREKNEIKKFVKEGKLNHPNNNCIDYFEDKIANLIIDEKYSGIILHRYINVYYNNHSFKVFLNPCRIVQSNELDNIAKEIENSQK